MLRTTQVVYLINNATVATYSTDTAESASLAAGLVATEDDTGASAALAPSAAAAAAKAAANRVTTWLILVPPWTAILSMPSLERERERERE